MPHIATTCAILGSALFLASCSPQATSTPTNTLSPGQYAIIIPQAGTGGTSANGEICANGTTDEIVTTIAQALSSEFPKCQLSGVTRNGKEASWSVICPANGGAGRTSMDLVFASTLDTDAMSGTFHYKMRAGSELSAEQTKQLQAADQISAMAGAQFSARRLGACTGPASTSGGGSNPWGN